MKTAPVSRGHALAIALTSITLLGLVTAMVAVVVHAHRPRAWDLSTSHRISQVPWPPSTPPFDSLAHFDVKGPVVCLFPWGKKFDRRADLVTFFRNKDEIAGVQFDLENQDAASAYATALGLARYWDLETQPLDEWYAKARNADSNHINGQALSAVTQRNQGAQLVALDILPSNDREKPYWIYIQIYWPMRFD